MSGNYTAAVAVLLLLVSCGSPTPSTDAVEEAPSAELVPFSLDSLQHRTFNYFWETALPGNYQIPDRWPTERFSSIAATGFGLTAYLVGVERGYVSREEAAERTLQTLDVLWNLPQGPDSAGVSGYRGLFYHFLTNDQALRYKNVELSTIDSGLLMAGILSAMEYFNQDSETERRIRELADQ
ncbi:MAG: Tat pathway signal protein, partial [Bacteroidota bacterium]